MVNLLKETSFNNFVYKKYVGTTVEEQKKRYERLDQGKDEKEIEKRAPVDVPIYFYHPDHLGTTNALTDVNGNMYQFFLNLPFGETMAEQTSISYYQTEFKFNGKELDSETGMYYYGARYYDPSLSIWMSVDPLAEQFLNFSPYNYTMNNPINMVDPDGRAPESKNDWVKNLLTCKYEWKNEVTGESTTPDGYRYVGKSNHSIVEDLVGEKTTFTDSSWDFGSSGMNNETTAHANGTSVDGTAATSEMRVSLAADVTETYDWQTNEVSKEFNGIKFNVQVEGSMGSAVANGQGMTLKEVDITANGVALNRSNNQTGFPLSEGVLSYNAMINANTISSSGDFNVNINFKGLYSNVEALTTNKYPTILGQLSGLNNWTKLNTTFQINNQ